ncbi:centrosome and spindle pole-associated protein 1 isoform X1 [Danio rerio]|uniref:Centrosome and spindle pole-associated protein 1 isoform X1 n=2 Tax=Danio rerio TaxID=7955 RepID=A0A8M6Z479_DANRE|nr:centrosome and spindle pole-associated protein 1 isoform X1 [Danio rerio]XP_017209453.1 centrosome and spindle pole-associated protein 1 isoform X1 [Danio rerio]|eukprot:XP_017209452.1 centrosome and spindle pole-associated protein 1 isoform X1 [Danio rerio]
MNVNISNFMANTEEIPYMEMKTSFGNKENIKPASKTQLSRSKQTKEEGFGLSLPLGDEYERKKQKLKQELRLDYRRFMSEKKNLMIADPVSQQSHMLSLPIKERRSAKEKLQDERNKEYNLFLQRQDGAQKTLKASVTSQALERNGFGSVTPKYPEVSPEERAQRASQSPQNIVFSRRDVATLTEPISGVPKVSRPRRHWEETPVRWGGPHRDHSSSDEEMELLEKERLRNEQENSEANRRGGKHNNSSHSLQALTPAQSRSTNDQNMNTFATGLMIGAAEGDEASQKRKERYRLELLQQIAEQQQNKRKEKELELRVAATGAVDPEKKPDRIKQFGAVTREHESRRRDVPYRPGLEEVRADSARRLYEERPLQAPNDIAPPDRPRVAFQSPSLEHSTVLSRLANASGAGLEAGMGFGATPITDDNHRSLSRTLGEMVAPRITGVRPPLGPSLNESYQTPYDNAYYYYGARNPLDPNLAYYGPVVGQQSHIPPEAHWPVLQPPSGGLAQPISHAGVVSSGPVISDRSQQPKENAASYQEALRQQIQERQQRRHREKVEKELFDAKIEAEMKAYEPWGRAGGGAPLRDHHGNLISDLKQMHKTNVEAYDSGGRPARIPLSSRTEPAGLYVSQPTVHTRGNLFSDLPTPQQLHDQEKYKDCLKQQIEEKRIKEAEERERHRLEEEKEERRLAEQRARIQREYEEEQERKRQKEKEQMAKNEELVRQAEERRKEAEKVRKEAEEKENEAVRKKLEREKQTHVEEVQRAPSPPLPALQKKLRQQTPRPPSVESHRSSATLSMRSMSAPHSPPVPARRNEIRATEEKRTVIRELSALRRQLRSEQRRLEGQLIQSNRNDQPPPVHIRPREQLQEDIFDVAKLRKQAPIRRPASHTTAAANMQNLQEFNRLKYRDGASREEMRQAYPEPPSDDHSLDIQQQALLRQQQRTINNLRTGRAADYFDLVSSDQHHHEWRQNSAENLGRRLLLDSERAFIDPSGDSFLLQSRRDQRMTARVRKPDVKDDVVNGYTRPDSAPDSQSLHSLTITEIERLRERSKNKMTSLNNMRERDWRSGDASAEEGDDLWSLTPSTHRPVSMNSVATDPWLRASSSDTLKRAMGKRRPSSRDHAGDWEGPSTYHG